MIICLELGADLHMAQLMPLPLTVSCFNKIQIVFTFLVPADPGSLGKRAVKRVCVCLERHRGVETCEPGVIPAGGAIIVVDVVYFAGRSNSLLPAIRQRSEH